MSQNLEKIELFLSASGLPLHYNTMATTYPFAIFYEVDRKTKQLVKIGRTNKVNDLNPAWTQTMVVEFLFEVKQTYVVKIFHADANYPDLDNDSKHRFIGEATFELANLLCSPTKVATIPLFHEGDTNHKDLGTVTIRAEAKADTRDLFCVTFGANNLANKEGFFAKSDPFLVILRCNEDSSYSKVWESPTVSDTLNPRWAQAKIPMSKLCNGDLHRPLRIEVYDHEKSGKHVFMGLVNEVSVAGLLAGKNNRMDVVEPDKQKKSGYKNSGTLLADDCSVEKHYSFTQYLQGGLEVSLAVAVDFTGSNGDPRLPDSLHFLHPSGERLNQYEEAILSVGRILEPYDHDQLYSVYGFGARVKNSSGAFEASAEHCFPLLQAGQPVRGVDGILQAYREAVHDVLFAGPTLFTPVLSSVAAFAESHHARPSGMKYTILLILTDGVINDMETTIRTLIRSSNLPLSVVIVGVGSENFADMKRLDSDKGLLSHGAEKASRDVVQFVPYRDSMSQGASVLAQQVLAEIPNQAVQYLEFHHVVPNKA